MHNFSRNGQLKAVKVLPRVLGIGRSRKRQHADRLREGENHLRRRGIEFRCNIHEWRMFQNLWICGEQRESLVDDVALLAKCPDFTVPTQSSEAAVLNKRRQ